MNILFTIPHMTIGGAQRVCYHLIKGLSNNRNDSIYLAIYSRKIEGNVVYDLSEVNHTYTPKSFIKRVLFLNSFIRKNNIDIVISFGTPNTLFDMPASLFTKAKVIVCERNDPAHFAGKKITRIISRLLMKFADGYVFQTLDAKNYYSQICSKNSVVIPNPIFSNSETNPTQKNRKEKVIITTGRLNKQKNHELLIKSFKEVVDAFPDYKLIIYGEGPERNNTQRLIDELGLSKKVLLPGAVNNVFEKLRESSLYVLSSNFEGMPNALMEAMSVGLPCISTDCPCGGPRELITHHENGLLVPPKNQTSLTNAIIYMLNNEDKAQQMGQRAMSINKELCVDVISQKWYDFFTIVINKK